MTETAPNVSQLREIAYRDLKAEIIACRLAPGRRITIGELAERTGLGVSPIREALTRLDHEGLVRTIPRKGYQVMPITMKSVDDLFGFWGLILPEIARRGIDNATDDQIRVVQAHFDKLVQLLSDQPVAAQHHWEAVLILEKAFGVLAESTDNMYLIDTYRRTSGAVSRVWALIIESDAAETEYFATTVGDWIAVLSRRDSDAAAETMARYIEGSHDRCVQTLAHWPSIRTTELTPIRPSA